ncbi:MAG: hypothetical protein JRJ15_12100 [Deltaproteobacteria bacterium]|nr:hypothetical protein [Deltaproteobacteria bacterium]
MAKKEMVDFAFNTGWRVWANRVLQNGGDMEALRILEIGKTILCRYDTLKHKRGILNRIPKFNEAKKGTKKIFSKRVIHLGFAQK